MHGGLTGLSTTGDRRGRLDLGFGRAPDGRSFLRHQYASYPFHICRPHYYADDPEGMATLYMQSVAGGVFESDRLSISIEGESESALHVTSQASTIVHGMEHDHAEQVVTIEAAHNSLVEYLPDCTILFPRAKFRSRLYVSVDKTTSVVLGDSFLAHDPNDDGDMFDFLESDTIITDLDGRWLVRDRFKVTGDRLMRGLPGLNGKWIAQATLVVIQPGNDLDSLLDRVRRDLDAVPDIYAGASRLPGDTGIGARIMARDGHALRRGVLSVWSSSRVQLGTGVPTTRRK
ncbi:MAG: urease accessory protein UreD [Methyloligella sp. ZOD6]